jgi:hypothetical protein
MNFGEFKEIKPGFYINPEAIASISCACESEAEHSESGKRALTQGKRYRLTLTLFGGSTVTLTKPQELLKACEVLKLPPHTSWKTVDMAD